MFRFTLLFTNTQIAQELPYLGAKLAVQTELLRPVSQQVQQVRKIHHISLQLLLPVLPLFIEKSAHLIHDFFHRRLLLTRKLLTPPFQPVQLF